MTQLILYALFAATQHLGPLVLVDQGQPEAEIVLCLQAEPPDRRAAEILQSSVRKMSGATLPIVSKREPGEGPEIDIGFDKSQLDAAWIRRPLRSDGFAVWTSDDRLNILSGGAKGSIYGVVDLLEKEFGCRKFSPTAEFFPKKPTLQIAHMQEVQNPFNRFRAVNGEFNSDQDYMDWQRLDQTSDVFGAGYYVHTFNRLIPPEGNFEKHPDWYALIDGKRNPIQLCPSNPEVAARIIAKLKTEMAAQPDKKIWSVSQNDNESYCHCPLCEKAIKEEGSPAGPIIRLVNKVAAAFPDKTISTLAYEWSRPAPKLVKPASNVQVMLCTIETNRSLPIEQDPTSKSFVDDIRNWSKICRNLYLWDYTVNFHDYVFPFPNLDVLQPNIRFFMRYGVHQHFQQSNTGTGHEFSELKSYLLARLLWDPSIDLDAVRKDFLKGYYGPAATYILEYQNDLESELLKGRKRLDIFESPVKHKDDYLSAANIAAYNHLFDEAESAVEGDPVRLARVKTARLSVQRAMLEIGMDDIYGPRGFLTLVKGIPVLHPWVRETLDDFYSTCVANGVQTLAEKAGMTPKAYFDATNKLLELQVDGNLAFMKKVTAKPSPSAKYARGDVTLLTNGVLGGDDYASQWVGWEGVDFDVDVDLGKPTNAHQVSLNTLWSANDWILHPRSVTCLVSADGAHYTKVETQTVGDAQQSEPAIRPFTFDFRMPNVRYVRLHFEGTKTLPDWHVQRGGKSWVFVDEVVVH